MVILLNVIYLISSYKKGFETISEELKFNVNILQEMIEIRDRVKACENLGMDVLFIIDDISFKWMFLKVNFIYLYVLLCVTIFLISFVF